MPTSAQQDSAMPPLSLLLLLPAGLVTSSRCAPAASCCWRYALRHSVLEPAAAAAAVAVPNLTGCCSWLSRFHLVGMWGRQVGGNSRRAARKGNSKRAACKRNSRRAACKRNSRRAACDQERKGPASPLPPPCHLPGEEWLQQQSDSLGCCCCCCNELTCLHMHNAPRTALLLLMTRPYRLLLPPSPALCPTQYSPHPLQPPYGQPKPPSPSTTHPTQCLPLPSPLPRPLPHPSLTTPPAAAV